MAQFSRVFVGAALRKSTQSTIYSKQDTHDRTTRIFPYIFGFHTHFPSQHVIMYQNQKHMCRREGDISCVCTFYLLSVHSGGRGFMSLACTPPKRPSEYTDKVGGRLREKATVKKRSERKRRRECLHL